MKLSTAPLERGSAGSGNCMAHSTGSGQNPTVYFAATPVAFTTAS